MILEIYDYMSLYYDEDDVYKFFVDIVNDF